ncbi:hypothetical protein CBS9595_003525 [Malassezia furfur]|nr:hypothetical protein CBS9595_003525 [Malassezia furfur]
MAERRSKWDRPAEGAKSGALTINSEDVKPAARAAAAAASKIAAQFGRPDPATGTLVKHSELDEDAPDGAYVHDIDINDHRNRYLLTKRQTQLDLYREFGTRVFTKGTWYPDRTKVRPHDPPLYLHISADTKEALDRTIARIYELMSRDLPPLLDDRLHRRDDRFMNWPEEKVPVVMESLRNFNVRSKLVGPGGMFVKYIQSETRVRTQIRGQGSGYYEAETGRELEEPLHIHLSSPEEAQLRKARELALDLVDAVKTEWKKAYEALGLGPAPDPSQVAAPPPPPPENECHVSISTHPAPPPTDEPAQPEPPKEEANGVSEEEAALRQYWKDYVAWEKSFVDYHGRKPTKEEGGQDVPPEHQQ